MFSNLDNLFYPAFLTTATLCLPGYQAPLSALFISSTTTLFVSYIVATKPQFCVFIGSLLNFILALKSFWLSIYKALNCHPPTIYPILLLLPGQTVNPLAPPPFRPPHPNSSRMGDRGFPVIAPRFWHSLNTHFFLLLFPRIMKKSTQPIFPYLSLSFSCAHRYIDIKL